MTNVSLQSSEYRRRQFLSPANFFLEKAMADEEDELLETELSYDQKKEIAKWFFLNAPAGEINYVAKDLKAVLSDEEVYNEAAMEAFPVYNKTHMICLEMPSGAGDVIVSSYSEINENEYLDPRTAQVAIVDHVKQICTKVRPANDEELPSLYIEEYRYALDAEIQRYVSESYPKGMSAVNCVKGKDTEGPGSDFELVVIITAMRLSPQNFCNGSWRSVWNIDFQDESQVLDIKGKLQVGAHYFEEGNVELDAKKDFQDSTIFQSADDCAIAIANIIRHHETEYLASLEVAYSKLPDNTFKDLRRKLPVTRTLFPWQNTLQFSLTREVEKELGLGKISIISVVSCLSFGVMYTNRISKYDRYCSASRMKELKEDAQRTNLECDSYKEKIKENQEKIKLNKQLPYLVGNIVEILEMNPEDDAEEDGANIDLGSQRKGKCVVLKTSTRQTIFLPVVGLVDPDSLKPGDLVGVNKYSYLILDTLPSEYDSRVKAMEVDEKPTEDYNDIGGLEKQIQELVEAIVLPMTHKERFEKLGVRPPKGVLLYGPPGTGKTLMARACAAQTNATFLKLAGPQLVSEVSGDREVQRTMLELLNQLDGFSSDERIKVIAATNRADILDPALMRSGRLDRKIEFPHPTEEARARILQIHSRKMNVHPDVNFEELARSTDDFNGAQLKAVCVEAGMLALRRDATEICS
ncbi:putative F-actin-capping protein subunit alpha [Arabidopsis thaliana]